MEEAAEGVARLRLTEVVVAAGGAAVVAPAPPAPAMLPKSSHARQLRPEIKLGEGSVNSRRWDVGEALSGSREGGHDGTSETESLA